MDEIEYRVLWKTDISDEWYVYYPWSSSYEDVYYKFKRALDNPICKAAKIVERAITYRVVDLTETNNGR